MNERVYDLGWCIGVLDMMACGMDNCVQADKLEEVIDVLRDQIAPLLQEDKHDGND